jgi:hypothetical protein
VSAPELLSAALTLCRLEEPLRIGLLEPAGPLRRTSLGHAFAGIVRRVGGMRGDPGAERSLLRR